MGLNIRASDLWAAEQILGCAVADFPGGPINTLIFSRHSPRAEDIDIGADVRHAAIAFMAMAEVVYLSTPLEDRKRWMETVAGDMGAKNRGRIAEALVRNLRNTQPDFLLGSFLTDVDLAIQIEAPHEVYYGILSACLDLIRHRDASLRIVLLYGGIGYLRCCYPVSTLPPVPFA